MRQRAKRHIAVHQITANLWIIRHNAHFWCISWYGHGDCVIAVTSLCVDVAVDLTCGGTTQEYRGHIMVDVLRRKLEACTATNGFINGEIFEMKRRDFVISTAAVLAGAAAGRGVLAAGAAPHVEYTPEAFAKANASGGPVLLDFFAPW